MSKEKLELHKVNIEHMEQYNQLLQRLDKLENPDKYAPLNRGQFQDDDSYIDALVQQRFDNMWNQKLQEYQQRYQEQSRQDQEVQAYKARQDDNVDHLDHYDAVSVLYRFLHVWLFRMLLFWIYILLYELAEICFYL